MRVAVGVSRVFIQGRRLGKGGKEYGSLVTVIPKSLRQNIDIKDGYIAVWYIDDKGNISVEFRKNNAIARNTQTNR